MLEGREDKGWCSFLKESDTGLRKTGSFQTMLKPRTTLNCSYLREISLQGHGT